MGWLLSKRGGSFSVSNWKQRSSRKQQRTLFECRNCREPWPCRGAQKLSGTRGHWRGHPSDLELVRQWGRENLPNNIVVIDPDFLIRSWRPGDPLGMWALFSIKSYGASIPLKDRMTLQAIDSDERRLSCTFIIRQNGNVFSPLKHWPTPCPCGCIQEPEVSTLIECTGPDKAVWQTLTVEQLVWLMSDPYRHMEIAYEKAHSAKEPKRLPQVARFADTNRARSRRLT